MAMDFFEHQEKAKKQSGRLVLLFTIAVIAIAALVYLVFAGFAAFLAAKNNEPVSLFNIKLLVTVVPGTVIVIALASWYKVAQLGGGGHVVAKAVGGTLISPSTTKGVERRLLNTVEEMAIASGVPTPPVYIMENEEGINAFAAGYSPKDAVIGVTRGCATKLSRDQLQGVIAHEFSHILNGDMKLNIRLMGIIFGIVVIGLLGMHMMRMAFYAGHSRGYSRRSSSSKNEGGAAAAMIAIGVGLAVIGAVGTFFGNLIRAAVSRQREFLADASAVQFTRNPDGISGALKRIGGLPTGSSVRHPEASEMSHMFFGQAFTSWFGSMMATHPPLMERIKRIDPTFNGQMDTVDHEAEVLAEVNAASDQAWAAAAGFAGGEVSASPESIQQANRAAHEEVHVARAAPYALDGSAEAARQDAAIKQSLQQDAAAQRDGDAATRLIEQIGQPTQEHLAYVSNLLMNMPPQLRAAAHDPYGARALVYALLIDKDPQVRQKQQAQLEAAADPHVCKLTWQLVAILEQLDDVYRLPLIDMVIPTLRDELVGEQYERFRGNIAELVKADAAVDLFEWVLRHVVMRHLEPVFMNTPPTVIQHYNLVALREPVAVLLSTLAITGHKDKGEAKRAVELGAKAMALDGIALLGRESCGLQALDNALSKLAEASPREKKKIVQGCAVCIAADHKITQHEAELLRAIADSLDCPMPPLLPGQTVG